MSRAVKALIEKDLKAAYGETDSLLVVNVHGLTGNEANAFRGELLKQEIEVHVVKNAAARRALSGTTLEPLTSRLSGPCAFVTGGEGAIQTDKGLIRLAQTCPALELKGGLVEGEPEVLTVEEISKRKSKAELQAEIIGLATSPGRRIAGQLLVGGRIAGCVKALVERLEKGEKIVKVA